MASSTQAKPRYEAVNLQDKVPELEAEIVRLHQVVVTAKNEDFQNLRFEFNVELTHRRELQERLADSENVKAVLKERLIDAENAKIAFQNFMDSRTRGDEESSDRYNDLLSKLQVSEEEREELVKDLHFVNLAHAEKVADLKEAASKDEEALIKQCYDENIEKQSAQQRADALKESTALEIEKLRVELAASKREVVDLNEGFTKDWDSLWRKFTSERCDREAAQRKAADLDRDLDKWISHHQQLEAGLRKNIDDIYADHEEEVKRLKTLSKKKREEVIASLRDEYEKKGAAIIARNTGLEVRVSQLQEFAKLDYAAITSLNHRHRIAKEALTSTMEQVHDFRDKFAMKAQENDDLIKKHDVELRFERREAAAAATKAEEEMKTYIGIAESRAADLVAEKEKLHAKLGATHDRHAIVDKEHKALQLRHSKYLLKERKGRARENELAKMVVELARELEVQRKGDFGVEALDDDELDADPECEGEADAAVEDEREGEVGSAGSGWESEDEDFYCDE